MTIYGYFRTMTKKEEREILQSPEEAIKTYAKLRSWSDIRIFVDQENTSSQPLIQRPCGSQLMTMAEPNDVLIVPGIEHLAGSPLDFREVINALEEADISLHAIAQEQALLEGGMMALLKSVTDAIEEKPAKIKRRPRDVKTEQEQRRKYLGGKIPFGWELDHNRLLVEKPAEQKAIREMFKLRSQGFSLRDIRDAMRTRGFQLSHQGVQKILDTNEEIRG